MISHQQLREIETFWTQGQAEINPHDWHHTPDSVRALVVQARIDVDLLIREFRALQGDKSQLEEACRHLGERLNRGKKLPHHH